MHPHVRESFEDLIVNTSATVFQRGDPSNFRSFMASRRLVYASVGSGLLWFDFEVLRRLRKASLSVGYVVLIDTAYADGNNRAVDTFAAWFSDVEVYAFSSIAAYTAHLAKDQRLMADIFVQCDACAVGRDDVARLLFFALRVGGAAFKLYNSGHAKKKDGGEGARRRSRRRDPLDAVRAESWRKRRGAGDLACRDHAGVVGYLETAAAASTASLWAKLWATERPPLVDRARAANRRAFEVAHAPRVAVRNAPSLDADIVGCFRAGERVVARDGYDAIWPWICLSSLTDRVGVALVEAGAKGAPPPRKLFMLTDGAPLDLGVLLRAL